MTSKATLTEAEGGLHLALFLNPAPASRPRVTKWGTYYVGSYKDWMKEADEAIPRPDAPLEGALKVCITFVVVRPKTTKKLWPRGDLDNYEKAILDALTKADFWWDDDQVVDMRSAKRFAKPGEQPHCNVLVTPINAEW